MFKNLLKVCVNNTPKSPRSGAARSPRAYHTETNDYVYNISQGNISGVDPGVIDGCPVCSKILREMNGESTPIAMDRADVEMAEEFVVGRVWLTPLNTENEKYAMEASF